MLPMTDTNLSSGGFPSLVLTFFADSSDLNTPTTLMPAVHVVWCTRMVAGSNHINETKLHRKCLPLSRQFLISPCPITPEAPNTTMVFDMAF